MGVNVCKPGALPGWCWHRSSSIGGAELTDHKGQSHHTVEGVSSFQHARVAHMNKHTLQETRIIYLTSVPQSLAFLRGKVGFMRDQGYAVTAISSPGRALEEFGEQESCDVLPVRMSRSISPFRDLQSVNRLVRHFRETRPAIVHAMTPKAGLLGMIASRLAGVPVRIYDIYGFPYMTATGLRKTLLQWTERVSCRFANQVYSVSHSLRDVAIADGICTDSTLKVIGLGSSNGVDATGTFNPDLYAHDRTASVRSRMKLPLNGMIVTFIGRLAVDKGVRELDLAWREIRDRYPDSCLVIAGGVDDRDPVDSELISRLEEDSRVRLLGMLDQAEIVDLYSLSDIVVLPTYREGFPNVLLEAAAMKVPVVATDVAGCRDAVIDGERACWYQPGALNHLVMLWINIWVILISERNMVRLHANVSLTILGKKVFGGPHTPSMSDC